NQDEVQLGEASDGQPPVLFVRTLVERWLAEQQNGGERQPVRIQFENTWQELPVLVRRNGRPAEPDEQVQDRDEIEIRFPRTAAELLEAFGRRLPSREVRCLVNGRPVTCRTGAVLLRNGEPAQPGEPVRDGDRWDWEPGRPATVADVLAAAGLPAEKTLHVILNGEPVTITAPVEIARNGAP